MPHSPACRWYVPGAVCTCETVLAWIVDVPELEPVVEEPLWIPLSQLAIALGLLALWVS